MCTPASSWLIILNDEPTPATSPRRCTFDAIAASTPSARAKAAALPDAMTLRSPLAARPAHRSSARRGSGAPPHRTARRGRARRPAPWWRTRRRRRQAAWPAPRRRERTGRPRSGRRSRPPRRRRRRHPRPPPARARLGRPRPSRRPTPPRWDHSLRRRGPRALGLRRDAEAHRPEAEHRHAFALDSRHSQDPTTPRPAYDWIVAGLTALSSVY